MEFRTPSQLKVAELGAAEGGVTDMIVVRQLKTLDAVFEKTDASLVVLCFSASFAGGAKTAKELTKLAKDFGTADVSFISVHINEGEYDGQELIIAEYGVEDFPTCVFIKPAEVRGTPAPLPPSRCIFRRRHPKGVMPLKQREHTTRLSPSGLPFLHAATALDPRPTPRTLHTHNPRR